ncbi:hypothetical protein [Rhizobium sp. BK176]|uniref:hypothetical protein n=1 Tax=Rhizobium sp. BK176 TaxID=2587071 RepID=UPI002168E33A|nr:hypothetical protein [Rhizobium sp. BK176]MCS4089702.1 hypothetical protein [Rhizobium sp. BK176]
MDHASELAAFDLDRSLGRLRELASKPDGWKGPDSVAMLSPVRDAAETFLRGYDRIGSAKDLFVGLDADGDVTLFLKDASLILDLSIGQDRTYSFYAETLGGQTFQGDCLDVTAALPSGLIDVVSRSTAG